MDRPPARPPAPLLAAVALIVLQGIALMVFAIVELTHLTSTRIALGVTTTVFFLVLGAGLLLCARGLAALSSWARGPVVALQLIGVLTSFSFWGDETRLVAVVIGLVSLAILVGILHPASTAALGEDDAG